MFVYTRLYINKDIIGLNYELFNFKYSKPSPSSSSNISKLEVIERIIDTTAKGSPEIPPRLIIWSKEHKYELGKIYSSINFNSSFLENKNLTLPEIDWLAQELSSFLNLPITRHPVFIKRN